MDAKRYNNIKLFWSITKTVVTFLLLLIFVASGISEKLYVFIQNELSGRYLIFLIYVFAVGLGMAIIFLPLNFYTDFYLEHKLNLSNQTFVKWVWENTKALLVSLVIGVPILLFFYYSLLTFNGLWWLPFAIVLFIVSVILARIVPVFVMPLFYKISPIDNNELKGRINKLAVEAGIKVENVYKFDMSKNTKKANAAFTGIGKSKRILLGDTLLDSYSEDEIETVIAHELGHYKKKHIIKNIIIGTASSFLTLFLIALFYKLSLNWFGFEKIQEVAALPILTLWGMLIGLIQTPITNVISRKYEYEADEYAVESTRKPGAFMSTLERLTEQNFGDKNPHPFVEWFFYSHPSIKKRIDSVKNVALKLGLTQNIEEHLNLKGG